MCLNCIEKKNYCYIRYIEHIIGNTQCIVTIILEKHFYNFLRFRRRIRTYLRNIERIRMEHQTVARVRGNLTSGELKNAQRRSILNTLTLIFVFVLFLKKESGTRAVCCPRVFFYSSVQQI